MSRQSNKVVGSKIDDDDDANLWFGCLPLKHAPLHLCALAFAGIGFYYLQFYKENKWTYDHFHYYTSWGPLFGIASPCVYLFACLLAYVLKNPAWP